MRVKVEPVFKLESVVEVEDTVVEEITFEKEDPSAALVKVEEGEMRMEESIVEKETTWMDEAAFFNEKTLVALVEYEEMMKSDIEEEGGGLDEMVKE